MYHFNDIRPGPGGGAALAFDSPVRPRSFGSRAVPAPRRFDLVVDLGSRIGSRDWLRGALTCTALCGAALWLAPGFDPIPAASAKPLSDAQFEQARSLAISPLALGADTGRRMAPTDLVEPLLDRPERPTVEMVATLGEGDGFVRALERAGVAPREADEVAKLVAAAVPLDQIKSGTTMNIVLGKRADRTVARPLTALSLRARFDLKLSLKRAGKKLALVRTPISVDGTPLRIQGYVGSSLYRSARAAGAPAKAVEAYIRAVASQTSISGLTPDDRFDIILEHRRAATGESETGRLLYAGLDRGSGKDLKLMQWEQGGRSEWYEASGVGRESGMLQRPVPGQVSSNFGMRRHPILGYSRMHKGIDFRAGYGTPILAATDGRVAAAGWAGGYGNQVRIAHPGGLVTSYSHMSRIVARAGSPIRQGQVIGYVGSTGLSTGPHLHYELLKNGVPVDPAAVKFVSRAQLDGTSLAAFRSRLRTLLAVKPGASRMAETASKKKPRA
ncbi:MAG TPA: peptidoglycan DD-metalloendopeptidase family protein [Allosphingosinicella sp.]|nr:peptidoglycan DD-metalloendopeptidase family protein [Allosphingosinicella sp.]